MCRERGVVRLVSEGLANNDVATIQRKIRLTAFKFRF